MLGNGAAAPPGHLSNHFAKHHKSSGNELVALVEASADSTEGAVSEHLGAHAKLAWCNSVDTGRFLVRFISSKDLETAAHALHGSSWMGEPFTIVPAGQLLSGAAQQDSGLTPRADSITTMQLPEQLDYFSAMLQEEQQLQHKAGMQQQQDHFKSTQVQSTSTAFQSEGLQDLEPCDAEWIPAAAADSSLLGPLEDGPLDSDASPLQSFSSNTSTCQLWSQRSIGAVARKDLAKFAAMQHMAQQHSCNSPTQASLLAAGHHVMGLGSTWSAAHSVHSSSSLASLALTAAGGSSVFQEGSRRGSSPSGQQLQGHHSLPCTGTVHTPRSPFHAAAPTGLEASGGFGSTLQQQQQGQQPPQLARSGSADSSGHGGQQGSAWAAQGSDNLILNLPSELGLGDSSAMADEEVLRVHNMATARQQQQQGNSASHSRPLTIRTTGAQHSIASSSLPNFAGILSSYGGEGSAGSPLGGPGLNSEGSGGFLGMAAGAAASGSSRFAAPGGFGSDGFPGSPHSLGLVPPPPPPPPQAPPGTPGTPPGGLLGQQPPPPPPPGGSRTPPPPGQGPLLDSYGSSSGFDGSRTGAISPVQPAPPPRSITPGGAGWQSAGPGNSPRMGPGSQPQSPSNGYRGPPPRPAGTRGFQHGMSNLRLNCQHSYDGYAGAPQPPPYGGRGSPVMTHRGPSPCGVPPPPPPGSSSHTVPPGYVAAATAAANACGFHISPAPSPPPPAGFGPRSGSAGAPLGPGLVGGGSIGVALPTPPNGGTPRGPAGVGALGAGCNSTAAAQQGGIRSQSSAPHLGVGLSSEAPIGAGNGGSDGVRPAQQQQPQQQHKLKADGALFVEELLQLLKQPGATTGNQFLINLTDLLDCALSCTDTGLSAASKPTGKGFGGSNSEPTSGSSSRRSSSDEQRAAAAAAAAAVLAANGSAKIPLFPTEGLSSRVGASSGSSSSTPRRSNSDREAGRAAAGKATQQGVSSCAAARQVPVDAAAFLGMLQEAAAPLCAAAAAAASMHRSSAGGMPGNSNRRAGGQQRSSAGADDGSRGMSQCGGGGGDSRGVSRGGIRTSMVNGGPGSSNAQAGGSEAGGLAEGLLSGSGGSGDLSSLPLNLLLRHSLAGGSKGGAPTPLLFPLHPRTTTHSSCGGSAPGTPLGTPMLLVPQTVPELLSTRAALIRLLLSAHAFVHGPVHARMASRLSGIEDLYDSMHEDPVVVKRRKCRDMAAMRDVIKRDTAFSQAVSSVSSMRNHIYSLSRKVLIGFGHMESLPIDLLLGGLTSELAAILAEPCDPQQLGQQPCSSGGAGGSNGAGAGAQRASVGNAQGARPAGGSSGGGSDGSDGSAAADTGSIVLPHNVVDFFMTALPVPKLALLVFVEFVPVDPAPCSTALPPSGLGAPDPWGTAGGGSNGGGGNNSSHGHGGGGRMSQQQSGRDHQRRSSHEHDSNHGSNGSNGGGYQQQHHGGNGNGTPRNSNRGGHGRWGHGRDRERESGPSNGGGPHNRMRDSNSSGGGSFPGTPRRGSRSSSFSSGGGASSGAGGGAGGRGEHMQGDGKRSSMRRSGNGGSFDLVAEAAALEAAASAAAPLVAAAVCDLPSGNRRQGSNAGGSSS